MFSTRALRVAFAATLVAGAATFATASPADAAGSTFHGCPYKAVCVYPGTSLSTGPEANGIYYSYGAHNLSNQLGDHLVVNNQSNDAWVSFCGSYGGKGTFYLGESPNIAYPPYDVDLTPVYSLLLTATPRSNCLK